VKSLALFNNKGGVGKTTMTFNLAHMFARLGREVAILDCDPQCNLSALALAEEDLTEAFEDDVTAGRTVATCLERVRIGNGDLYDPTLLELGERLSLLPGDLSLSRFEGKLAKDWSGIFSTGEAESAIHVTTALERLATSIANTFGIDLILFDVGPSLGALNRAVLLACDAVVIPLAPDLFSLRGLENVGEALSDWRTDWAQARIRILQAQARTGARRRDGTYAPPEHAMQPIGYVIQQHLARDEVPLKAYGHWADRIPDYYARFVLRQESQPLTARREDPHCLSHLRHFASLVPLAQAARKPIFDLKHADGVLGTQFQLVERARVEFTALAEKILARLDAR
jgi:chromosome partitioning protein